MKEHQKNVNSFYAKAYQSIGFFAIAPAAFLVDGCGLFSMEDRYSGGDDPTHVACAQGSCTILFGMVAIVAGEAVTLPLSLVAAVGLSISYPFAAAGASIRDCASGKAGYETVETPSEPSTTPRLG